MSYQPEQNTYQFRVIRDVEAGEELTICYTVVFLTRAERQAMLLNWGFQCVCPACEDTVDGNKFEAKRVSMIKIRRDLENQPWDKIITEDGGPIYKFRLAKLQQLTGLMRSMGLVGVDLGK
jgi:hypothetical protein